MIKIKLTKDIFDKCYYFAKEEYKTSRNHYYNREQYKDLKNIEDHAIGKFAEVGVYNFFSKFLPKLLSEITPVDFKIYNSKNKSFNPDLTTLGYKLHVKSCRENGHNSWIFQYGGKGEGHFDPILITNNEKEFIFFCVVDLGNYIVSIYGCLNAVFLKNNGFYKLPLYKKFYEIKRAVYWDDLKKLKLEELWSFVIQARKIDL